jgi:hypothetical protein
MTRSGKGKASNEEGNNRYERLKPSIRMSNGLTGRAEGKEDSVT